jgi:hypothetical protein
MFESPAADMIATGVESEGSLDEQDMADEHEGETLRLAGLVGGRDAGHGEEPGGTAHRAGVGAHAANSRGKGRMKRMDAFAGRMAVAGVVSALTLLAFALLRSLGPGDPGMMVIPFLGLLATPFIGAWVGTLIVKDGREYYRALIGLCALFGLALAGRTLPTEPAAVWGGTLRMTGPGIAWFAGWLLVFAFLGTLPRRAKGERDKLVLAVEIALAVILLCSGGSR